MKFAAIQMKAEFVNMEQKDSVLASQKNLNR
jgi:hypothetical protein